MIEVVDRNNNRTEIVYGKAPAGTPEQVKDACSNVNWVRNDISEIKSYFIKLGFHLEEILRCEIYKVFGFDDFYKFCEANFHLSRSTVSRHINLFLRFSMKNGKYETPTMFIADRWKDYNYSQLCEMLPLKDKEIEKIKPEMTIEQIREYKKSLKQKDTCATSQKGTNESNNQESEEIVCDIAQEESEPDSEIEPESEIYLNLLRSELGSALNDAYSGLYKAAFDRMYDAVMALENLCRVSESDPDLPYGEDPIRISCLKSDLMYAFIDICSRNYKSAYEYVSGALTILSDLCDVAQTESESDEKEKSCICIEKSVIEGIVNLIDDILGFVADEDCCAAYEMLRSLQNRLVNLGD